MCEREHELPKLNADINLTITMRDDDTDTEVKSKLGFFAGTETELKSRVFLAVEKMMKDMGVTGGRS